MKLLRLLANHVEFECWNIVCKLSGYAFYFTKWAPMAQLACFSLRRMVELI